MNKFNRLLNEEWIHLKEYLRTISNGIEKDIWPGDFVLLSDGFRLDYQGRDLDDWNQFLYDEYTKKVIEDNNYSITYYLVTRYPNLPAGQTIRCTCGVSKTMGKDDQLLFHSSYCDLITKVSSL